jgi:precorrin-2 dehydrogenase/sirohydrochlorin ferrochelatase
MNFKYPISLNLEKKNVTVVGGGKVALRKVKTLLSCGAIVKIISPQIIEGLKELKVTHNLLWISDYYQEHYLEQSFLVIAATNNREINHKISTYCRENNILVNVIDSTEDSDFIVNSSFCQGDLMIAVSTNGQSPLLASKIKKDLAKTYGPEYQDLLDLLGKARALAKERIPQEEKRRDFLIELLRTDELLQIIKAENKEAAMKKVMECLLLYWE